jgi:O-antigen/teichoic acid export membrane protein
VKNIFGLGVINIINLIIPLILIPFLSRVLDSSDYGYIMYIATVQMFSTLFLDYSLNITSVKDFIQSRSSRKRRVFLETQLIRIILGFFFILLMTIYSLVAEGGCLDILIYVLPFSLGHILISPWYFQSINRIIEMAKVVGFFRIVHLLLVFCFINNEHIYDIVLMSQSYTYLLAGVVLCYRNFNNFSDLVSGSTAELNTIKRFKKSLPLFVSDFAPNLYTNIPSIALMGVISPSLYFQYNLATKFIGIGLMLQTTISRSIYPILCGKNNIKDSMVFLTNLVPMSIVIIPLCIYSSEIYTIVTGKSDQNFGIYLSIMAIGLFFAALGNYLGQNYLLVRTDGSLFSKVITISCFISGGIGVWIVPSYEAVGAAWLLTIGRVLYFSGCLYCFFNYKKRLSQ